MERYRWAMAILLGTLLVVLAFYDKERRR